MGELEKDMYYGASAVTMAKASVLRSSMTKAEVLLWERLKGKNVGNLRFRRQHPIGIYIADFYCHAAKLVVEVDGKVHLQKIEYDRERTAVLNGFGIDVIRFSNEEVLGDIDGVVERIRRRVLPPGRGLTPTPETAWPPTSETA